ncbi:MAG: hypothetical protein ACOY4K_00675 [Pseudomonadota bacterium]
MTDVPTSVSTATVRIFGVELVVHHLSTGQRVIEPDSLAALFAAMGDPNASAPSDDELAAFWKTPR